MITKYVCDSCKKELESDRSDEEALEEAKQLFGSKPEDWKCGAAVICDDCFNQLMERGDAPKALEEFKKGQDTET